MQFFSNLSIQRKQMLVIMLTSSAALLLACAVMAVYDSIHFRSSLTENTIALADVVGRNSTAAVDFEDAKSANDTLLALHAKPNIIAACLYDRDGAILASFQSNTNSAKFAFPPPHASSHEFQRDRLNVFRPIIQSGELVGTVYIASDLKVLWDHWLHFTGLMAGMFAGALIVSLILSSQLQKVVSGPILHLARAARAVALEKNYSLRVTKQNNDEVGQLIDRFNEMLAQIQERDATLERRVEERTREMLKSLSFVNATLEATADGILALDLHGNVSSFNARFAEMWKFPEDMLARRSTTEMVQFAARQVKDEKKFLENVQTLRLTPEKDSFGLVELKDGRIFERYALPQKLDHECVGSVLSFRDVTQRKQSEAALAYERDLLRALMDTSDEHIYFKDRQSCFIRSSHSMAKLFKAQSPDELVGKSDLDFFAPEHAQQALEDEQTIIRTGEAIIGKIEKETWPDGRITWVLTSKMPFRNVHGEIIGTFGISKNITAIKEAEEKLDRVHKQLMDASRQAGMAEVATSVLHNVGNVLNSVNVSSSMLADRVQNSKVVNLNRAIELMRQRETDLGDFLTNDPKGKQLPPYLFNLSTHLLKEQKEMLEELTSLTNNVAHIKEIVSMQQSYAKFSGVKESLQVVDLVEDSIRMNNGAMNRHQVTIIREFAKVPPVLVEKHKVLQILVNLLRNAKYACDDSGKADKRITLRVTNGDDRVRISIIDNGIGIPAENLTRIFNHGFTTRKEGHGFGLHSGALAARELGGSLSVFSEGPGLGAAFTLELPINRERDSK